MYREAATALSPLSGILPQGNGDLAHPLLLRLSYILFSRLFSVITPINLIGSTPIFLVSSRLTLRAGVYSPVLRFPYIFVGSPIFFFSVFPHQSYWLDSHILFVSLHF